MKTIKWVGEGTTLDLRWVDGGSLALTYVIAFVHGPSATRVRMWNPDTRDFDIHPALSKEVYELGKVNPEQIPQELRDRMMAEYILTYGGWDE